MRMLAIVKRNAVSSTPFSFRSFSVSCLQVHPYDRTGGSVPLDQNPGNVESLNL